VNIAGEPDGKSYRLTMRMSNVEPGRSLYVMQAPVRVFVQSGLAWKEIPARAPDGESATVVRLTGSQTYQTVFEPNLKEWTELMPGWFSEKIMLKTKSWICAPLLRANTFDLFGKQAVDLLFPALEG
jgi:macrolide transport system ATP-binding/permease protein/lipoprotein-releasing system ATP-binding protein